MALDERRLAFLDWLTQERREGQTQAEYARSIGVDPSRVAHWKRDPEFVAEWKRRIQEQYGGPARLADHMALLDSIAKDRDARDADRIKAIGAYWSQVERNSPDEPQPLAELTAGGVRELSNEQLAEAARELAQRTGAGSVTDE